ncbi:MAG: hypothetical protein KDF65_14850 [Anaerolineae bacterium]|nr:hypothetical protein [Anaerolineae bacterium]
MTQLKSMLFGGIFTLIIFMTIALAMVVATEAQGVPADQIAQPTIVTVQDNVAYAPLTDAIPQRDITVQYYVPLGE